MDINCFSLLTEDLLLENQELQFILISHHPYIINQIPHEYWKIITRKGNLIQANDAKDLKLKGDKQAAFMQLLEIFGEQRLPKTLPHWILFYKKAKKFGAAFFLKNASKQSVNPTAKLISFLTTCL